MASAVLRSVPAAFSILCGYAVGTIAILALLSFSYDPYQSISKPWELFADDMLTQRYQFGGFDVPYSHTVHYSITASAVFVFGLVIGLRLLALSASLWFAPAVVRRTDGPDHARKRRIWGRALRSAQRLPSLRGLGALFLVSMIGAWLCFGVDGLVMEVRQRAWMRDFVRNPHMGQWPDFTPIPVVGWMTRLDLVWLVGVALWSGYASLVRVPRRRIGRSRFLAKRWCLGCGYPLVRAGSTGAACSECGAGA